MKKLKICLVEGRKGAGMDLFACIKEMCNCNLEKGE